MKLKDKLKVGLGITVLAFLAFFLIGLCINVCGGHVTIIDIFKLVSCLVVLATIIWLFNIFFKWAFKPLE